MARVRSKVDIDNRAFASLTMSPGGDVHEYAWRTGQEVNSLARVHAPSRTGALKRRIFVRRPVATPTSVKVRIECSAEYGLSVHNGTGPVTTSKGNPMRLYIGVLYGTREPASWVGKMPTMGKVGNFNRTAGKQVFFRKGQRANPFLTRARDNVRTRRGI